MTQATLAPGPKAPPKRGTFLERLGDSQKLLGVIGIILAAGIWQLIALAIGNPLVLPTFGAAGAQLLGLFIDPVMQGHLGETLFRVLIGFGIGSLIGLVLGASIGSFQFARQIINPYLNFLRAIAPIAWVVPATIWLGIGDPPILFVVIYAATFPVAINTISGISSVHPDQPRMARTFGLSPFGVFQRILVPSTIPYVLVGARVSLGFAFMAVIGAEMIIGRSGLGYIIYDARTTFDTDLMFGGILALGIVGYLGDLLFVALRRRVFSRYYAGRVDG